MHYAPIDLNDPPPARRSPRLPVVALLLALVAGFLLAGVVRAEDERFTPVSRSGREAVLELAERHFPAGTAEYATRIAGCESSFNPKADTNPPYIGLWQIDPQLHGWRTVAIYGRWRSLYEPEVNAAVAADILADQGWGAWPVCSR